MAKKTKDAMKFTSKLGVARGHHRSRIWLQGARLTAAGFTPGTKFGVVWYADRAQLFVNPQPEGYEMRVVSGKGDLPIIDMVGARVLQTFGNGTHVNVSFKAGQITITRA